MRILIIKTSSLGDVIHTLPAVSDARQQIPELIVDWVVEEAFAEIPTWHSGVHDVITVALRKWRKNPWHAWRDGQWAACKARLQQQVYDKVIDAQGLIKSALLTWYAKGTRYGLDRNSAREPWAAWCYQRKIAVPRQLHAITRIRWLFAQALDYPMPDTIPNYGLSRDNMTLMLSALPHLVFLHGTTWASKEWPESYWQRLAQLACNHGYRVRLPWGNELEKQRAMRIANVHHHVSVIPASNLEGIAAEISAAVAVVGVDTGLAHLAAALQVPAITLYGATQPGLTGTQGYAQTHLQAALECAPCLQKHCLIQQDALFPPCYNTLSPDKVWLAVQDLLAHSKPNF